MFNQKKGITLISLVVTIVILLILTGTVITNTYTGSDYKKYKLMCADVKMLEDRIIIYYNKYGELPLVTVDGQLSTSTMPQDLTNSLNTTHQFWKIDTSKLNGITLNYGDEEDIFIIDTTTHEVYYLFYDGSQYTGIEYNGTIYYTD